MLSTMLTAKSGIFMSTKSQSRNWNLLSGQTIFVGCCI